ncbi:MAG: 50S ribosomal protein L32 [Patescibacteria group bacterium]|nr:50S ribosomal protein L32 [Patescibacteria group bacterium]
MPVPKQKHSKSRTRRRRSHQALKPKQLVKCGNCGKMKQNHTLCGNCGYYKGRQIVDPLKKQLKSKSSNNS